MHFCCEYWTQLCIGLAIVSLVLTSVLVLTIIIFKLISIPIPNIIRFKSEESFLEPKSGQRVRLPSLVRDEPSVYLSVIVPAFNEEKRLPKMLTEVVEYCEHRAGAQQSHTSGQTFTYEVIVVDDGSDDKTSEVALDYSRRYGSNKIRVLTLERNRGKGGAVQLGMLSARGQLLLFADADGATQFSDFDKLEHFMTKNIGSDRPLVAIGSRAHLQKDSIATRSLLRTILMYGFHLGVWLLAVRTVRDTQCGFKLFDRRTARLLFPYVHCQKWAFDVELLLIAEKLNSHICEIAVNWTEIEGSKVVPFWSWLQMGKDVAIIALKYGIGVCSIPELNPKSD